MQSVFTTLTYPRDKDIRTTWLSVNETANRYVQRVRRTLDSCEYLKTYEVHKDGYPHIHILFIFSNLNYPDNHSRWLPDNVFKKLKSAWTHGLSDHQSPTSSTDYSALSYILKYVAKTSSSTHLWRLLLSSNQVSVPELNANGYPIHLKKYAGYHYVPICFIHRLDRTDFKIKKIKLISWSRNFIQSYLNANNITKPCPNAT